MKKFLSAVICAALLVGSVSAVPINASAEENDTQSISATLDTPTFGEGETIYTYDDGENEYEYVILDDGTIKITKATCGAYDVIIPARIDGRQVTVIGMDSFGDNIHFTITINDKTSSNLNSITIPNGVKVIERYAFYDLHMVKEINLSDTVEEIGEYAFGCMDVLESVDFGDSVKSIGNCAFYNCPSLTEVEIPDSVTSIEKSAFENCAALTTVTFGSGLAEIGEEAFYDCYNIQSYNVDSNNKNFCSRDGVLYSKDKTKLYLYPSGKEGSFRMPNTVKIVGKGAFRDSKISDITFSGNLETIEDEAFYNCSGITGSCEFPETLKTSGTDAFNGCTGITEIHLGENVEECDFKEGLSGLLNIFVSDDNQTFTSIDGVLFNKEKTRLIVFPSARTGDYTIPYGTTYLTQRSFFKTSLTSVTMPDTVRVLGEYSFCGSNIQSVVWSKSLVEIKGYSFLECKNFTLDNELPSSLKIIGGLAFGECPSIKTATIPENVEAFSNWIFYMCSSLESVEIKSEKFYSIGSFTFAQCPSLTEVTLPSSITAIDDDAFDSSPNVTIKCYKNSYAREFAETHNIPYILLKVQRSLGDVNNDGRASSLDAYMVLRAYANMDTLDEYAEKAADTNSDGRITSIDALNILRYSAGYKEGSTVMTVIEIE